MRLYCNNDLDHGQGCRWLAISIIVSCTRRTLTKGSQERKEREDYHSIIRFENDIEAIELGWLVDTIDGRGDSASCLPGRYPRAVLW